MLCDPMDGSTSGFPVVHHLPEFAQTPVHWVCDAIQTSPLSAPSPPALNLSQHQSLFQCVGSFLQVAKVLELQLYHQSFQWMFRVDFLQDWLVWSPCCSRDSQESSPAPQFEIIISSALSLLYGLTLTSVPDYWMQVPPQERRPIDPFRNSHWEDSTSVLSPSRLPGLPASSLTI